MRTTTTALAVALAVACGGGLGGGVARADDGDEPPSTFHKGQLGLSARLALGLRGIVPYHSSDYCGATDSSAQDGNAAVCAARAPTMLELEAAYGVAKHTELVVEFGFGLEQDFGATPATSNGPHPFYISPGARFFFSETRHSKLFVDTQLVFDFTGYKNGAGASRGTDYGARGLEGWWLDLHRAYGIYIFAGETAEFSRWLEFSFEAGVGFQARYP
jgi:hypothetical protein